MVIQVAYSSDKEALASYNVLVPNILASPNTPQTYSRQQGELLVF